MRKKILLFSIISMMILCFGVILNASPTKADSGWDNDYSSSSSSSSYSSSDSSGSDDFTPDMELAFRICIIFLGVCSLSRYRNLEINDSKIKEKVQSIINMHIISIPVLSLLFFFIPLSFYFSFILFFVYPTFFVIYVFHLANVDKKEARKKEQMSVEFHLDESLVEKYHLDSETIKNQFYQIFIDVQNAWMNFDYDSLKKLCSDELYNSYKSDLEVLQGNHGRNIMKDFHLVSLKFVSIDERNNILSVHVILNVSFYDYVIDDNTGKVIRGDTQHLYNNQYLLEYIKNIENISDIKCPNCGGNIINHICDSCHSTIDNGYSEFVLNEKKIMM